MIGPLLLSLIALDPDLVRDFGAANDRALEGNRPAAIALYQSLIERGADSADVYYNLGNTYAEAGQRVEAVLAWERALRRAPGDPDTLANLETVRSQLAPKSLVPTEAPAVALADVIESFLAPLPRTPVALGLIASAWGFFLALALRRRAERPAPRRLLTTAVTLCALFGLLTGLALVGHGLVDADPRVVVTTAGELREGPNANFKSRAQAWAGARARVLAIDGEWAELRLQDGTSGWLRTGLITRP